MIQEAIECIEKFYDSAGEFDVTIQFEVDEIQCILHKKLEQMNHHYDFLLIHRKWV